MRHHRFERGMGSARRGIGVAREAGRELSNSRRPFIRPDSALGRMSDNADLT
jgi:hypothetical protein